MTWVRRILLLAVIAALVVGGHLFVRNNEQTVELDFVLFRVEAVSVWIVLLGAFGGGLVLAGVVAILRGARLRLLVRRYRKEARDLSAELHELRNLPLASGTGGAEEGESPAIPDDGLERGG